MADKRDKRRTSTPRLYDGWVVGKLVDHGEAMYQGDQDASMSYFIRLQTRKTEPRARQREKRGDQSTRAISGRAQRPESPYEGRIITRWGKDLKRAIRESKSAVEIGQIVTATIVSREPLRPDEFPKSPKRGGTGYWNKWEVETVQFIVERARFARALNDYYQQARRNGVAGNEAFALYLIQEGGRRLAAERYPNPEDRKAFTDRLRNFLEVSPERAALIARTFERVKALKVAQTSAFAPNPPSGAPPDPGSAGRPSANVRDSFEPGVPL
jgi:hypothetical protein